MHCVWLIRMQSRTASIISVLATLRMSQPSKPGSKVQTPYLQCNQVVHVVGSSHTLARYLYPLTNNSADSFPSSHVDRCVITSIPHQVPRLQCCVVFDIASSSSTGSTTFPSQVNTASFLILSPSPLYLSVTPIPSNPTPLAASFQLT